MTIQPHVKQSNVEFLSRLEGLVAHDDGRLRTIHEAGIRFIPLYLNHSALQADPRPGTTTFDTRNGTQLFTYAVHHNLGVLIDDGVDAMAFSVQEVRLIADRTRHVAAGTFTASRTGIAWLDSALETPLLHPATLDLMKLLTADPAPQLSTVLSALKRAELYLACTWCGDELAATTSPASGATYARAYLTSEPHGLRPKRETELVLLEGKELLPVVAGHGLEIIGPQMDQAVALPPDAVAYAASTWEGPTLPLTEPGRAAHRVWREAAAQRRRHPAASIYPPFLTVGGHITDPR